LAAAGHIFSLQNSDDGNATESRLTLTPVSEDDASHLICRVKNSMIPGAVMEDSVRLDVHCKFPFLSVSLSLFIFIPQTLGGGEIESPSISNIKVD
jgi:hypothetical protein